MAGRLAPTPTWLDQYGVNSSFLFQRGHGYVLAPPVVEPIFDIGHMLAHSPLGASPRANRHVVAEFIILSDSCKDRLSRLPSCFCLLKSERCLMSTNNLTFGSCAMRQPSSRRRFDGWCNIVVEPGSAHVQWSGGWRSLRRCLWSNPQAPSLGRSTGEGQHVAQHGDSHEAVFMWTDAVLEAASTTCSCTSRSFSSESCGAHKVLLMPRLMADPIEYGLPPSPWRRAHGFACQGRKVSPPRSLAFSEVFDFGTFAREMRPCAVTEELPVDAVRVHINVSKLHDTKREGEGNRGIRT